MQNTDMRLESGTCNVCSAPCSSCMHLNHALMGSKAEEFSGESCRVGEANNQYSMDEGNVYSLRSRACESSQHALSETSNRLSANSSHGSLSENAQSRQMSSNKYQDSKYLEVHDDNTSCISRASDRDVVNDSHQRNAEGINISCSSASVSHLMAEGSGSVPSANVSGLSEIPTSKDEDTGHSSPKVQSLFGQSRSGKSLSSIPSLKHVERDSRSHTAEKLSEYSIKNSSSSFSKEREPIVVSGEKSIANKDCHVGGTTNVSLKVCPKTEADTDNDVCDDKDEDHKCSVHDGPHEKAEELVKSPGKQEPQSEDDNDESDVMEHDIKVCDICGDAGREDLLAICSRCSDGAEHTYCMKEMLEKVPEGEWLCEECKDAETENKRLDVEEKKILEVSSTSQVSDKRLSDNIEVAPAAKRQALESSTGLPKASSPKRLVPLSRESSFKSFDKLKAKPGLLMPTHNHSGVDDTEIARSTSIGPRGQIPKSKLLKSKSFNINSKPKVKLVDEFVPQKLKGVNGKTSKNMETPARMTSKSTLFKSSSLGRSSATEPKVKMLSPKSATASELKGSRHLKESGSFDRKFPSRNDRPVASSVLFTPKGDQRLTPRGDTPKPSTVNNSRELKVNHDGKLSALSKSTSNISRKSLDRQDSSERTSTSVDEALQDVPPRSRETANQVEKTRDSSSDRVMPVVPAASKSPFCQKCKEFGHPPECCTAGSTQEAGAEISATTSSSSKEDMHKGNRLKAAIQAALLRRPEIYKKKEVPNQTDEVSTPGTELNCEVALQDQLLVSSTLKNSISAEDTHEQQEILENSTSDSSKCSSANDLKQLNSSRTDFCSQPGKSDSIGLAAGKPVARSLSHKAMSSVLSKMLAIPEYEYIWQGDFEVHRNGKPPDLCTGVQAHLSSCASPKVLEVVNKFPPEVPVNEVPRLSTWPSQFRQGGAREDNIALYFFARDIESYERHYKGLLDHMIRNDLALKGIFDGVELLIFPSNQLPENSQRWNMLFFLWGVFRGRRISLSDSAEKICIPSLNVMPVEENSSSVVATLSEMHCLPKCMDEESIDCDKACNAVLPSTSVGQCQITKASVLQHSKPLEAMGTSVCTSGIVETKTDSDISVKRENTLYLAIPSVGSRERGVASNISKEIFLERMNSHEDQPTPKRKQKENCHYIDLEATIDNEERGAASYISKDKSSERMNSDEYLLRPRKQEDDHYIDLEATVGNQETSAASNINKDEILEKMDGNEDQLWLKKKPKKDDHYIDLEATFQEDLAVEGINWQQSSDKEVQYVDLSDRVMQASAVGSLKLPWNEVNGKLKDGESSSKKLMTDFSRIYGCYSTVGRDSFNGRFASLANNPGSCSSVEDKVCEEACDEKIICEDLGTMERTFFPIGTQNISDSQSMLNSVSLKGLPEFEDQFQDGIPNLELALGGETKALPLPPPPPAPKGMLPFLVGAVDRKNNRPDSLADGKEDDGVAASLSLSLSVPSSNKEHSKAELLPDGHRVNTSLLLFGRFTDK